ncbi:KAP family NTPase [Phaeobacter inhibens]|uniref:KAP family NTPase n=1 Tax=Phaeobacter inhibens TaxID=221822 RepID=UPI0021A9722E|nr:KAP family NTPase [Phaeobacter inhibens]UWR61255.1 KAP family NTPase [Phaeobacter inhibens]
MDLPNQIARRVVEKYLKLKSPRYALLIDAPWGCGKTHFIKAATECETDPTRLYVSLYNVHSADEFDWALVRALNPWTKSTAGKVAGRAKELASGLRFMGLSVDLTKVNMAELALQKLPQTIIFDDIERCGLPVKQLWGLINRFVEHESKRVILIANSDKHSERPDFLHSREKLVGQIVTIEPNVDAAMTAVWGDIPDGQARRFLQAHQAVIKTTFEEAKHQNLRLLLRAIRDAADFIDQIEPEMVAHTASVQRLTQTLLALHMAYHEGAIDKDDLRRRGDSGRYLNSGKDEDGSPLGKLKQDHPNADILNLRGGTLPTELGVNLLVDGYASAAQINIALKATGHFTAPKETPDWIRLWNWGEQDTAELEGVIARIKASLTNFELTNPGEILEIYGALNFMGKYRDDFCPKEHARNFFEYVRQLANLCKLPARSSASIEGQEQYGFEWQHGSISYGGHGYTPDIRAKGLCQLVRKLMDQAWDNKLPEMGSDLLDHLQARPEMFRNLMVKNTDGLTSYWSTPILHHMDRGAAALAIYDLSQTDRAAALRVLDTIFYRKRESRAQLRPEHDWIEELKVNLVAKADAVSAISAAQMRLLIQRAESRAG